jgi:hypothetical protein
MLPLPSGWKFAFNLQQSRTSCMLCGVSQSMQWALPKPPWHCTTRSSGRPASASSPSMFCV